MFAWLGHPNPTPLVKHGDSILHIIGSSAARRAECAACAPIPSSAQPAQGDPGPAELSYAGLS